MTENIIFEWDEEKRRRNIIEHGVDFVEAVTIFEDPQVSIVPDVRKDYGEERFAKFSGWHILTGLNTYKIKKGFFSRKNIINFVLSFQTSYSCQQNVNPTNYSG